MLNSMQMQKLDELLDYYFRKDNFTLIHEYDCEGYKWRAIQIFREKMGKNYGSALNKNFVEALKAALAEGRNLIYNKNQSTLFYLLRANEKEMRNFFHRLELSDTRSLEERLAEFVECAGNLVSSEKMTKLSASDAMTCLAFLKPDEYYIYRPFVMEKAYKYFNDSDFPYKSAIRKACAFHDLCDDVLEYITVRRSDLIEQYKSLPLIKKNQNWYQDDGCHLLVQNILYSLWYVEAGFENSVKKQAQYDYEVKECENMLKPLRKGQQKKSSDKKNSGKYDVEADYQSALRNIRTGKTGETIVFENLQGKDGLEVEYVSRNDDSKHYDILLRDCKRETYIEVKTVSYSGSRPRRVRIYISQAEVEFSRENRENYLLYVVLINKKSVKACYQVFKGDVTGEPLELDYSKDADKYHLDLEFVGNLQD